MNVSNIPISETILFNEFSGVLEEIRNCTNTNGKQKFFNKFLTKWQQNAKNIGGIANAENSFYDALRLFVPGYDERKFGIKEATLNQLVCGILHIEKIADYKSIDDLVNKLVNEVSIRHTVSTPKMTLADVNDCLDSVAESGERKGAFHEFFRNMTKKELRWIFLLIINRMRLGVPESTIMTWYHENAERLHSAGYTIREVCDKLYDGSEGFDDTKMSMLGRGLQPMLLAKIKAGSDAFDEIASVCKVPFYAELKYDGERMIIHKYRDGRYRFFSRRQNDFSHKLGADSTSLFSSRINAFFKPGVEDCILDGELLVWDKVQQKIVPKNQSASDGAIYDVKSINEGDDIGRTFAIFDILYYNGKDLRDTTLDVRLQLLQAILLSQDPETIFISKKTEINSKDEFEDYYKNAVEKEHQEGIVVKSKKSLYVKHKRSSRAKANGWFKIKPFGDIDLAVVGVSFRPGRPIERFYVESFVLGAKKADDPLCFKIVGTTKPTMNYAQKNLILNKLGLDEEKPKLLSTRPKWISGSDNSKDHPNTRFSLFDNIPVVEVGAYGYVNGLLKWPHIKQYRDDKPLSDVNSMSEVYGFDEQIRTHALDQEVSNKAATRGGRKRPNQMNLCPGQRVLDYDAKTKSALSTKLKGAKVCVLNTDKTTTIKELQEILVGLGATCVPVPGKTTNFLVCMNPKQANTVKEIRSNKFHVVHGNWLIRCRDQGKLVAWTEDDIIHSSTDSEYPPLDTVPDSASDNDDEPMMEHVECGSVATNSEDPAPRDAEQASTSTLLNGQKLDDSDSQSPSPEKRRKSDGNDDLQEQPIDGLDAEEMVQVEDDLFTDCVFYFHGSIVDSERKSQLSRAIRSKMGQICRKLDSSITHVVVATLKDAEAEELEAWNQRCCYQTCFVSEEWIKNAIDVQDKYCSEGKSSSAYDFVAL